MYAEANFIGDKQCQSSVVKDICVQLWIIEKSSKDVIVYQFVQLS